MRVLKSARIDVPGPQAYTDHKDFKIGQEGGISNPGGWFTHMLDLCERAGLNLPDQDKYIPPEVAEEMARILACDEK